MSLFWPHQWHFLLFKYTRGKFFLVLHPIPWCKCHVSIPRYATPVLYDPDYNHLKCILVQSQVMLFVLM